MEAKPDEFQKSNIEVIQQHMKDVLVQSGADLRSIFAAMDADGSGYISLQEFRNAVIDLGFDLTEQVSASVIPLSLIPSPLCPRSSPLPLFSPLSKLSVPLTGNYHIDPPL